MASEHAVISYFKSGIRIIGYLCFLLVDHHPCIVVAGAVLIFAEMFGIVEEIGH